MWSSYILDNSTADKSAVGSKAIFVSPSGAYISLEYQMECYTLFMHTSVVWYQVLKLFLVSNLIIDNRAIFN